MRKLSAILVVILSATLLANVSVAQGPSITTAGAGSLRLGPGIEWTAGTLWSNGFWDFDHMVASHLGTGFPDARSADDFLLDPPCPLYEITEIRGTFWTSSAEPSHAIVEIYADSGGAGPQDPPLFTFNSSGYGYPLGPGNEVVREYTFPTPGLTLTPGKYWVSPIGLGDGSGSDWAYLTVSAVGAAIQLQEGHFKCADLGYNDWTPLSLVAMIEEPRDFAFDIDGHCAPTQDSMFATHVRIRPSPDGQKLQGLVRMRRGIGMMADAPAGPTAPVAGAMVDVRWRLPDGTLILWTAQTDARGRALFRIMRDQPGTHRLCILNATHPDYTYDPELNWETCATVDVY